MSNYVRANFCIRNYRHDDQNIIAALGALETSGCTLLTSSLVWTDGLDREISNPADDTSDLPTEQFVAKLASLLPQARFLRINLEWRIEGEHYTLLVEKWTPDEFTRVTFGIEERAFFSPSNIAYHPNESNLFSNYRKMLTMFIIQLDPDIGLINFECDYLCNKPELNQRIASWGNYFPYRLLDEWTQADITTLMSAADEHFHIVERGILTFIHPMQTNQAWSPQHEQLESIIRKNIN